MASKRTTSTDRPAAGDNTAPRLVRSGDRRVTGQLRDEPDIDKLAQAYWLMAQRRTALRRVGREHATSGAGLPHADDQARASDQYPLTEDLFEAIDLLRVDLGEFRTELLSELAAIRERLDALDGHAAPAKRYTPFETRMNSSRPRPSA